MWLVTIMASHFGTFPVIAGGIGAILIIFAVTPSIAVLCGKLAFSSQRRYVQCVADVEDEEAETQTSPNPELHSGLAMNNTFSPTADSASAYSDSVDVSKRVVYAATVTGFLAALAGAVLSSTQSPMHRSRNESWIQLFGSV
jgi:hypothetical protein